MPFPYVFPFVFSQWKVIVNIGFFRPGRYFLPWAQYVDISDYVLSIHIRRGRQHELDRFEAGTCRLVLNNRDRRFDPSNTSGPYFGNLLPLRRVRVSIAHGANLYHLFTGFIEAWPHSWPNPSQGLVELEATDGFKILNLTRVSGSFPAANSADRINQILDAAEWPEAERSINPGRSNLQAVTLNNVPALAHLQEVAITEGGRIFCAGNGLFTFHDRQYSQAAPYLGTFGDQPGELPYEGLVIRFDDSHIWNDITIQPIGLAPQRAYDEGSIENYFRRSLVRERTLHSTENEARDAATWLLSRYKEPFPRVQRMTLKLTQKDTALLAATLPAEIGHRVTVIRRPPGPGSGFMQADYFIEGIEWDITREEMRVSWQLSPADADTYWVLGDARLSVLGVTTRLGF